MMDWIALLMRVVDAVFITVPTATVLVVGGHISLRVGLRTFRKNMITTRRLFVCLVVLCAISLFATVVFPLPMDPYLVFRAAFLRGLTLVVCILIATVVISSVRDYEKYISLPNLDHLGSAEPVRDMSLGDVKKSLQEIGEMINDRDKDAESPASRKSSKARPT